MAENIDNIYEELGIDESFRDTLATVDKDGKRIWLFPKKPKGKLFNYRAWFSVFLLAFMIVMPFIKVGGHPVFLFNVPERQFILFGQVFWPQDFHLFVIGLITFFIFIIFFTVIFGRVWCGWACPQTIFMEMIYRRIEYWIEGDASQQKKLYEAPWSPEKFRKRLAKYSLFMVVSFIIAHIVLAWVVGIDRVFENFTTPPSQNPGGFTAMTVTTLVIFGVYARFREQMCTTFCPYGRLQGVLLGNDSMVVGYDYQRGEPRGKLKEKEEKNLGDCIDCGMCVRVCPTGIDIRNGTQLECVNCTACIDACDEIMEKIDRPKRLIGFKSIESINSGGSFHISARQKAYSVLLVLLVGVLVSLLLIREEVEATITRNPGTLYYTNDDGTVSNLYSIHLINKTFDPASFRLSTAFPNARIEMVDKNEVIEIAPSGDVNLMFFIYLPKEDIKELSTRIDIDVLDPEGKKVEGAKATFLGPLTAPS